MSETSEPEYRRPTPTIGDRSSARERREDPRGWAMGEHVQDALADVIAARRDIRRYRPEAVDDDLIRAVLEAGHSGPSVGHSQPWRFIVVRDGATRDRAAHLADTARLRQARQMMPERAARLLDLKLEGLREAPVGIVVACDRRAPASGVLGRATFTDTDLWSCACAIENMWLTARALGLGMGWVTLFEPADLADLLGLPEGVETLGWMCLGWPDERPPEPGLQRAAWSTKLPLDDVVLHERWPSEDEPASAASERPSATTPPPSYLRGPEGTRLVDSSDDADSLLAPPEALGVLDRSVNRCVAVSDSPLDGGTLVLVGADHPVARLGVSAYETAVTADVMRAAVEGRSLGATHARAAGLDARVVDAGVGQPVVGAVDLRGEEQRGDLLTDDAMSTAETERLVAAGRVLGEQAGRAGLVALGEVGVGNTTVAAALAAALLQVPADDVLGLGAGSDAGMMQRKRDVVARALARHSTQHVGPGTLTRLASLGGPEFAVLTGVVLGAASVGAPVVLDGMATSVAALVATRLEPSAQAYLVAGQRSREAGHASVLDALGLEPLLDLRLRAGEGVGACLASGLILSTVRARRQSVRTS